MNLVVTVCANGHEVMIRFTPEISICDVMNVKVAMSQTTTTKTAMCFEPCSAAGVPLRTGHVRLVGLHGSAANHTRVVQSRGQMFD
jgi:hypothetical protein